jgi:hypothetical protein
LEGEAKVTYSSGDRIVQFVKVSSSKLNYIENYANLTLFVTIEQRQGHEQLSAGGKRVFLGDGNILPGIHLG